MDFSNVIRAAVMAALLSILLAACGGGGGAPETFTVTGVITPEALNRVDSDTNDPETPAVRNNDRNTAQVIRTPALIGGFVAAPGTESRFGLDGDEADVYDVLLEAGQQVVLEYPVSDDAELHLHLLDEVGVAIDAAVDPIERFGGAVASLSLEAPSDGRFFVRVWADKGLSNYSLSLGSTHPMTLGSRRAPRVSDEFVPGELVVRTHPMALHESAAIAQGLRMRVVAGHPAREQLWLMSDGQAGQILEALMEWRPIAPDRLRWASTEMQRRYQTLLVSRAMSQRPEVVSVSPNFILGTARKPDDPEQEKQWFHSNIDLPKAWIDLPAPWASVDGNFFEGAEVVIAVVDTGVFRDHEDLREKLLEGYDFILKKPGGDDPGDSSQPGKSSWHGTHVAGIAAAETNNGVGVAGVSWGAKIMPVRTLGEGGGTLYDTLQGIRYAAGLDNDSKMFPKRRADVINLSLGGGTFVQAQADLYQEIRDLGIFVVAASGNSNEAVGFPAAYPAVFSVGATDKHGQRAPYSSFGYQLDLVAPGGSFGGPIPSTAGILSSVADDRSGTRISDYGFYQGTSMATAVVSGVVALARSIDPNLNPERFLQLLASGRLTDDLGAMGWDPKLGWGQINAAKTVSAVREFLDQDELPPLLYASPGRLEFGLTDTALEIDLDNVGGGSLRITGVKPSDPTWLSVEQGTVDTNGLGSYRLMASREGLTESAYVGSVLVEARSDEDQSLEQLSIPVLLRVEPPQAAVDSVGRIYVLLLDETGDPKAQQAVMPENGSYSYRFDDVAAGEYRIVAGTDMNGDGRICDPGEACGAYPFERVLIDRDRSGLDFSVGFRGQPVAGISTLRRAGSDLPRSEGTMRVLP